MSGSCTLILSVDTNRLGVSGEVLSLNVSSGTQYRLSLEACGNKLNLGNETSTLELNVFEQDLDFQVTTQKLEFGTPKPVGIGEANEGANVGGGAEVFQQKIGDILQFRTLTSGRGDTEFQQNLETIEIDVSGASFVADCQTTDAIGDGVYVSSTLVADRIQVTKIDISDPDKMPAIGVVESKIAPTVCVVRHIGRIQVPGSSFVVSKNVFYTNSGLSSTIPLGVGEFVQRAGQAVSSDEVLLQASPPIRRSM